MIHSKLAYVIQAQFIRDTPRLKAHLQKLKPSAVIVMDGLGLARELKALLPNTIVIHRNYGITSGDNDVHLKVTPERWLELRAKEAEGGIWLHTTNEPAFNRETMEWHVQLMERCIPLKIPLVVGNWSVGKPEKSEWTLALHMLTLLDQNRDLFILGLHEYACGIITSGLYGGYPNHAGVQKGDAGGKNLIPKDNWPDDVSKITKFHMGRFNFLLEYCEAILLKPPRIIVTEHGMDDVSDIKGWADTLDKTPPYDSIRSWKSLRNQWAKWFDSEGWSSERAYFEQLKWANETIYANSPVEAQAIFAWNGTMAKWPDFDVSEAGEFQSLMEAYAQEEKPVTRPIPMPKPSDASNPRLRQIQFKGVDYHNIRDGAGTDFIVTGKIYSDDLITIFDPRKKDNNGLLWCWMESETRGNGWICVETIKFIDPDTGKTGENPTVPPALRTSTFTFTEKEPGDLEKLGAALENLRWLLERMTVTV